MYSQRLGPVLLLAGLALAIMLASPAKAGDKISKPLHKMMLESDDSRPIKVWVYLRDKDAGPSNFEKAASGLTPRSRKRRGGRPLDFCDLPVRSEYIDEIRNLSGGRILVSRWLNAVAISLTEDQILILASKEFVKSIEPVRRATRSPLPESPPPAFKPSIDSSAYGFSYRQDHMLGIDSLHRLDLTGAGVLLAFLDTGFLTTHPAFDSMNILDAWNFIDNNPNVTDIASNQTNHGTATLSVCGGFEAGQLIGPAYGADYILAKTEIEGEEIQIEEDYWVAAAEWADSLGADIISTSLGYNDWYTYADMDGNTAVTSIAADIAASRGILVVVSAGNEGDDPWHYITAPADADSVVAIGAVDINNVIVGFSSYGPTYDGRLKPEVVALGTGVWCARDLGGYYYKQGTSLSAPQISGAAALILEAQPSLRGRPMAVRQRLIESADRYLHPDEHYGNGLPNPVLAAGFGLLIHPMAMINIRAGVDTTVDITTLAPPEATVVYDPLDLPVNFDLSDGGDGTASLHMTGDGDQVGLRQYFIAAEAGPYADTIILAVNTIVSPEVITYGPNPCTDSLRIFVNQQFPDGYKIEIFSISGEMVYRAFGREQVLTWPAVNERGEKVASGVYIIRFSADGIERKVKILKM